MEVKLELKISSKLLRAYAAIHDGSQFREDELGCRLVTSQTDEGHPVHGSYTLEVYGNKANPYAFYTIGVDLTPETPNLESSVSELLFADVSQAVNSARERYLHLRSLADAYFPDWLAASR